MFYCIYKVTNQISGKLYIGAHKTNDLDDGYMGSGTYLKRAIEKHGIQNFEKEILFVYETPEEMWAKEAELVTADFLAEANTYNMKVGGFGGFDHLNGQWRENNDAKYKEWRTLGQKNSHTSDAQQKRVSTWVSKYGEDWPIVFQGKVKETKERNGTRNASFLGKRHSQDTKALMSGKAKERMADPRNNPQYGTRWIHNLELRISKRIEKTDPLPEGWREGRKMKF